MEHSASFRIQQTETQHNPSRKCNNCIWASFVQLVAKIPETSKVLKLKISNLSSTNFWSSFLMSQQCQTMSPHQEATASETSSLIWGLKEFTEVVGSLTRPWISLSCFKTTPSIKVHRLSLLMDCARAVSLKISTSQRTPNTIQNYSKLIDLVMRIQLTRTILIPRFSNFPRYTNINFRMCLYLVTWFLTVAVTLLCRSKGRTISSPFTN